MLGEVVEAGGADEDRDARLYGAIKARGERRWRGKVDQDIALAVVEQETVILLDRRRNSTPHAPLGREQGDTDGLLVGAHGAVMAQHYRPRN